MAVRQRPIVAVAVTLVVLASAWVAVAREDRGAQPVTATTPTTGTPSTATTVTGSTLAKSTSVASSTTTEATRQLSPAWVGSQAQDARVRDLSFDEVGIVQARLAADYALSNPNQWTTPMGSLCWANFELNRAADMAYDRETLDHALIPVVIQQLGIGDQVPSGLGPATTRAVIAILEGYATTTTTAGATTSPGVGFASSEFIAMLRLLDYGGGDGTEWLDALDAVAGVEWAAAVRAGDGLPADVLSYADGLAANAREQLSSSQPEISGYIFGPHVDGYRAFVEMAKYDQNCLRSRIGDPPLPLPNIPALTTTTAEAAWSAFAAAQFATPTTTIRVDSSASITSSTSANSTTTSTTVRLLSPAWIEAQPFLDLEVFPDSVEMRRMADRYRANPNQWSTPMGALCWGSFELSRGGAMSYFRGFLDIVVVPDLVEELGLGEALLGSGLGPATSRWVIDAVASLVSSPPISVSDTSSSTTAVTSTTSRAAVGAYSAIDGEFVELLRFFDYVGGTGTEWLDAVDAVAGVEWAAAVRAGDVLPEGVLRYADSLGASARDQVGRGVPDFAVMIEEWEQQLNADYWAFVELAKYDQNCLRADIGDPPEVEPLDIPDAPRSVSTTSTTVRSGSVRVSGAGLLGYLSPGEAGLGVGYSRSGGVGSLSDTTFSHGGVGYEVERLLWWPNGTVRLDVYPDGSDAVLGDDALLVVTPSSAPRLEYAWRMGDARHLGGAAEFVWDTTFVPEVGERYIVELRVGVPAVP